MVKSPQILVELQESLGSDKSIALSAWTSSFNKDSREAKTDEQVADLVKRLAKDGHSTPFESVVFRFWMRIPIFIDRQIVTHRIASHSGLSGRYRTMPKDYYGIPKDVEQILEKLQRGSKIKSDYEWICQRSNESYSAAIHDLKMAASLNQITNEEYKRCREVLRGQLPTSGMTERTSIFNLRSFCNFQRLRNSEHAQPEIQQVAQMMLEEVEKTNVCPIALEALKNQGWNL